MQTTFGYDKATAEKFRNVSLTPKFFEYAFEEYKNFTSIWELYMWQNVPFLCDPARTDAAFTSPNGEHKTIDFCKIDYPTLIDYAAKRREQTTICNFTLSVFEQLLAGNLSQLADEDLALLHQYLDKLCVHLSNSPVNFLTQGTDALDEEVFCGKFSDTFKQTAGAKSIMQSNEEMVDLRQRVMKFIRDATPAHAETHDAKFCGTLPVEDYAHCHIFDAIGMPQMRAVLQGYILVTPNTSVVRDFVDKLNRPLRSAALFRDTILDLDQIAIPLQDAIANSDLHKANILPTIRPFAGTYTSLLEHLFNASSDPNSLLAMVHSLTDTFKTYSKVVLLVPYRYVVVESEKEMEKLGLCLAESQSYFSGLVFPDLNDTVTEFPPVVTYKIRHLSTIVDNTEAIIDSSRHLGSRDSPWVDLKYITFGFSFLQEAIERNIIETVTGTSVPSGLYAQQEPYPCVNSDTFNVTMFLSLFLILSWMIPSALLVKNIVWEKEMRLKEMMRIMGLGEMIHWVAWAIQALVFNILSIVIITVLLKFGNILPKTDFTLLFVFLLLFALAAVCQSLLISTFFSRANIATACTALLFFLFFFPFQLSVRSKSPTFSLFTLLLPQTALGYGMTMVAIYDDLDLARWESISALKLTDYKMDMVTVLVALVIDCFIYVVVAWYISAVCPGDYGVPQPFHFFLTKKYWCGPSHKERVERANGKLIHEESADAESVSPSLQLAVEIRELDKVYGNDTKALDSLSLNFYESQITAFLGHNGAGKTTTISILTGLYPPTTGTAYVYGMDIRYDMRAIRDFIGVCPQHNILFDQMTVTETLQFYGSLKGLRGKVLKQQVDSTISECDLDHKRNALSKTLSGGMKRKLSIGIAFIGGSKLIILDEPTAGIDAHARRSIWQFVLKHKNDRTIILSTHHMDEADILADRIAIIAEGQLRAVGSSLFLKKRFGEGYHLTFAKQKVLSTSTSSSSNANERGDDISKKIEKFMTEHAPDARLVEDVGTEVIYALPTDACCDELAALFTKIETNLADIHIFLSVAPARDLKLKKAHGRTVCSCLSGICRRLRRSNYIVGSGSVSREDDTDPIHEEDKQESHDDDVHPTVKLVTSKCALRLQHAKALFYKRLHTSKRSLLPMFVELLLPIALLLAAEIYTKIQFPKRYDPVSVSSDPMLLVSPLYGNNTQFYFNVWNRNTTSIRYLESLVEPPGIGVGCVDGIDEEEWDYVMCTDWANGTLNLDADVESQIPYNVSQNCSCTPHSGWNCDSSDYPMSDLQSFRLNTTETLWDLTYRNLSQFRLITADNTTANALARNSLFLGGWSFGYVNAQAASDAAVKRSQNGLATLSSIAPLFADITRVDWKKAISGVNWTTDTDHFIPSNTTVLEFYSKMFAALDTLEADKVWFNNKPWASLPVITNAFYNAALRATAVDQSENVSASDVGILAISHPMNNTVDEALDANAIQKTVSFRIVLMILVLCVITSSFCLQLVDERRSFSKHLQRIFGISPWIYELVNFLYDFATYIVCVLLILLMYFAMGVELFTFTTNSLLSSVLLFVLFGFCVIPFVYLCQLAFNVPALAFISISVGTFFVGVVCTMTIMLLENLETDDEGLKAAHTICAVVFLVFPQYNFGMAIYRLNFVFTLYQLGSKYLGMELPLMWDLMGKHCFCLFASGVLYWLLLLLNQYWSKIFKFLRYNERRKTRNLVQLTAVEGGTDDDVKEEKHLVDSLSDYDDYGLVVKGLSKSYGDDQLAVNNVSFAVRKGQCFGLLGTNGAGKTTTFSMLTGSLSIGDGDVFLDGNSMTRDGVPRFRSLSALGYCPQFDALNLKLTAREHLAFYARARGIREKDIPKVVDWMIERMHLTPYAKEVAGSYSGGNKRKLSAAIALVGDPPVVLLDEPSAGMDPSSQQFMWNLILQLRRSHRTVVITSHSMEECEVLCTKTAIMVDGQLRCIGSIQHLKERFGDGYTLALKLSTPADIDKVSGWLKLRLPQSEMISVHCSTAFFRLRYSSAALSDIFRAIGELRRTFEFEFSVSQTTLDDVFVSFAAAVTSSSAPSSTTTPTPTDVKVNTGTSESTSPS
ncbi:ABC transporterATP-binding protein [Aphelenchoides avenae]|nr:ABC transporterATP-binding protein [Aphelenchus avenae]